MNTKKIILIFFTFVITTNIFAQWAYNIGGISNDVGKSITVDDFGNVYITGSFSDNNVDFDPGTGTAYLSSNGGSDIFFAKYSSIGEYQWAYSIGGPYLFGDGGSDIAVDVSGNIYIIGSFRGSNVDFDPGSGTESQL